jgi:GH25 family lysozyme M1 (1,4-beta-N-acetylmuramidase)
MANLSFIPLDGQVRLTARANLRSADPSTAAPVIRKLEAGAPLHVTGVVVGQAVQGNAHWFMTDGNGFVWSGACGAFETLALGPGVPPPTAPVPGLPTMTATGEAVPLVVDIYHGDRVDSFTAARNAGVLGIIHKATTGGTGTDDAYARRRDKALAAGLLWGAYHWGTAAPARQQVDNFLGAARPDADTLVALDFERDVGNQMSLQGARDFLAEIQERLGRRAVLYSGSTIKGALGQSKDPFFGQHRLWLAQYGPVAKVQSSWDGYWLWQHTDGSVGPGPRHAPGIPGNANGELDCNRFHGSPEQLAAEWAS